MKSKRTEKRFLIVLIGLFIILLPCIGQAEIPSKINYQGYLTSAAGVPVNGTVAIVFTFYTVAIGGSSIWSETQNVTVNNGVYNVNLGDVIPITSLPFGLPYYLGVKVGTDPEMTPRIPLTSVGYAFRAKTVDSVGSHTHGGGDITTGTVSEARIDPLIARDSEVTATVNAHASRTDNPHSTTATQVGAVALNQANSISNTMIVDGSVTDAKITGLISGSKISSVGLNADMVDGKHASDLQARVTGTCPAGSSIRSINADGSVQCEIDSIAPLTQIPSSNTITIVDSTGTTGLYTSITIGNDGFPVIAYFHSGYSDLKVAKCGNAACSSGNTITTADSAGMVGYSPSIAIGIDNLPIISYAEYVNTTTGYLKVVKCGNAACSAGNNIVIVDSAGRVGEFSSLAIGTDGLPVISYSDYTNSSLKVAKCGNISCSSSNTITTVDNSGSVGYYTSIAVDPHNLPVIAYGDYGSLSARVGTCTNAACTGYFGITTIDSGYESRYFSVTIGTDGIPIISYSVRFPSGDWHLRVKKLGDPSPMDIGLGANTSITIGSDGLPIISVYYSGLLIVKCRNVSCTDSEYFSVDGGDVGAHNSITIGVDGLPVISYQDVTNGDLKVVKCANRFCVNNWSRR